jgi:hypothetical protein
VDDCPDLMGSDFHMEEVETSVYSDGCGGLYMACGHQFGSAYRLRYICMDIVNKN